MAKTKKESAKNILKKIKQKQKETPVDIEAQVKSNVEQAKNIAEVAVSIERLSDGQTEVFEKMLEVLEDIPKNLADVAKQNEQLADRIADAIVQLDKDIAKAEEEGDEEKVQQLTEAKQQLTAKGEEAFAKLAKAEPDKPKTLAEKFGVKRLGVDLETMRASGGGLRGLASGFKAGFKRDVASFFGTSKEEEKTASFEDVIKAKKGSKEVSGVLEQTRADKIKERLQGVPDYLLAQRDPETGAIFRNTKTGGRLDMLTKSGKVNPAFDPGGMGTSSAMVMDPNTGLGLDPDTFEGTKAEADEGTKSRKGKSTAGNVDNTAILKDIAANTKETATILKDTFGADKNENVRGEPAPIDTNPFDEARFSGAGSDVTSEATSQSLTEAGGEGAPGEPGAGGGGGLISTLLSAVGGGGATALLAKGKGLFKRATGAAARGLKGAAKGAVKGLKGAGRFLGRAAKFGGRMLGKAALPLAVGMSVYDAYKGFTANSDAPLSERLKNAGSSVANGLTFGLVGSNPDEIRERAAQATAEAPAQATAEAQQVDSLRSQAEAEVQNTRAAQTQAMEATSTASAPVSAPPVIQQIDNSQNVAPQAPPVSSSGGGVFSVRNTKSSYTRFMERRLTRVM